MSLAGQREQVLQSLTAEPLDVLVVGGGIVGSGIARDAAMRGLKVGLVEQHDFAFGTSSRSSRLLHGGLRYLAQGRIGLVHEASIEKKIIHHIAPHLAEPLPFIFPTYRGNKNWVLWQLKIGVKIYDWLCGGRNLGKSTWLSKAEVLEKVPSLSPANLDGAVRYFDGFTNDARLTIDTLRSAQKHGAVLLNYCKFENANSVSGRWRCELTDKAGQASGLSNQKGELSPLDEPSCRPLPTHPALSPGGGEGGPAVAGSGEGVVQGAKAQNSGLENSLPGRAGRVSYAVGARAVVNATGPWADGLPHSDVHLRITKGIHVVVERARVAVPDTVVMTEGKRILFAIPWGERTILGTTDTDYTGSLDHVTADAQDVRYVLQITNQFFPNARLAEQDVISTWAGLRPLIADPNGKPSDISRGHEIRSPEPGWWDVAGGKLTTYRLMAEQTVDQIVKTLTGLKELNRELPPCRTADEPLLPAADIAGVSGILPPEFSRRAVEHYCANEWAVHLDDVMVRRTSWHCYFGDAAQRAERVADWMGELLGWSEATRAAELTRYKQATSLGDSDPRSPTALASAA